MDALIAAALTVGLPEETAWTGFRRVEGWYRRCSEISRQDPVYTNQKREVATKPFSHRRPLQNVFNDRLSSRIAASSGLHVSDFPNRITRAIVLTGGRQLSFAANDEVTTLD